jgi:flagellar motor switch protein FliM
VEPILTKKQIAELLLGIKSGQVSTDLQGEDRSVDQANVTPLNLFQMAGSSESLQRIPNLDIILDNFASNFGISLTNQLQKTVTITRTGIDTLEFQEYLLSQKDAGAIGVLSMDPLKNGALMVLDSELCFSLIEIMLGASDELAPLQLDRKPTTIELNVLKTTMTKACSDIDKAFTQVVELVSSIVKVESNSRLVSIAEADADILAGRFQLKVGSMSGIFDLVFPVATLDPIRDELRDLLTVKTVHQSGWQDRLLEELKKMSTTVIAQSGTITMPVRDVVKLREGDIIDIDYDPNSPLKILVEENLKFFAVPGTISGKKAIHLTGVYDQGE